MEAPLWSYDEATDRAYLSATLATLSKGLARTLEAMSEQIEPSHRATAEWIDQLGRRFVEAVPSHATQGFSRKQAHQIEGLCELARQLVRVDYLAPREQGDLTQQLERVWSLAAQLDGLSEP